MKTTPNLQNCIIRFIGVYDKNISKKFVIFGIIWHIVTNHITMNFKASFAETPCIALIWFSKLLLCFDLTLQYGHGNLGSWPHSYIKCRFKVFFRLYIFWHFLHWNLCSGPTCSDIISVLKSVEFCSSYNHVQPVTMEMK